MENGIKLGIIICTYNRKEFLLHNLNLLNSKCRLFVKRVYVIDNASNIDEVYDNDFIKIIHNKNLGGSGGYARGMYEAKHDGLCSHIMLMDDDVLFSPDTIRHAVLKLKKNNDDWIGFAMTTLETQNIVYEAGAYWNGINVKRQNVGLDLTKNPSLSTNNYNYSGWWSLIMPISVIDTYGYPFPFFIKFDDVEYSFRRKNEKILFDQKFYVSHESFKNKKNPLVRYYGVRNAFILNDLYFKHSLFLSINYYFLRFLKLFMMLRFAEIKAMNYGILDYLKGPSYIFFNSYPGKINNSVNQSITKKINIFIGFIVYPLLAFRNIIKVILHHRKMYKKYKYVYKILITEDFWVNKFKKI